LDNGLLGLELLERLNGGPHDVDRVVAAQRLGEDVPDTRDLDHRANRSTGDDAGTRRGRLEHHAGGTEGRFDFVRNGSAIERNEDHGFLGCFTTLADAVRYLASLAKSDANSALAVSNDHDTAERERSTALVDLGHAIDSYQPLFELVTLVFVRPTA
jgi:hypothetical protein